MKDGGIVVMAAGETATDELMRNNRQSSARDGDDNDEIESRNSSEWDDDDDSFGRPAPRVDADTAAKQQAATSVDDHHKIDHPSKKAQNLNEINQNNRHSTSSSQQAMPFNQIPAPFKPISSLRYVETSLDDLSFSSSSDKVDDDDHEVDGGKGFKLKPIVMHAIESGNSLFRVHWSSLIIRNSLVLNGNFKLNTF